MSSHAKGRLTLDEQAQRDRAARKAKRSRHAKGRKAARP